MRACQGGFVFSFSAHPATLTVTQGIQDAFRYLGASWRRWLPMVLIVSAGTLVAYAVLYSAVTSDGFRSLYYIDSYSGQVVWAPDAQSRLWSIFGAGAGLGLLAGILNLVAGWVFTATAISGLRHRPLTLSFVVERGLRVFAAGFILGLAAVAGFVVLVLFTIATMGIGFLLFFAAVPAFIYMICRLQFMSLAIFDGFGVIDGMKESWRLSQRSVLRIFGWALMAVLLTIVFSIAGGIASLPFSASGATPIAQAVSSGVSATASCFLVFMIAALYESQRARMDPGLYGPAPMPFYAGPGYPPAPYGYPAQPPAGYGYPPQPPAGQGYPPQPPAGQGWTGPSAPLTGYGWVNPSPQPPTFNYPGQAQPGSGWVVPGAPPSGPAYPSAPQGWVAPPQAGPAPQTGPVAPPQTGPVAPPPPDAGPTEPPAPTEPPTTA